jgi:endonuclease/exonuclease/phosphatase family metal-dependent hydrolase
VTHRRPRATRGPPAWEAVAAVGADLAPPHRRGPRDGATASGRCSIRCARVRPRAELLADERTAPPPPSGAARAAARLRPTTRGDRRATVRRPGRRRPVRSQPEPWGGALLRSARGGGRLRIAQLNAGSLLEPRWEARRHEIVAWIDRLAPDVVCLQEVWQSGTDPNTAGWIVEHLSEAGWSWAFGGAPFAEALWRTPASCSARRPLPLAHRAHAPPAARRLRRGPVRRRGAVGAAARQDGRARRLLDAPGGAAHRWRPPLLQVVALDELVRAAREALDVLPAHGRKRVGMPAIVCGDFNAEPDSDEIRFLTSLHAVDGRTPSTRTPGGWPAGARGSPRTGGPTTSPRR